MQTLLQKTTPFWGGFFVFLAFYGMTVSPFFYSLPVYDNQRIVQVILICAFCFIFPIGGWLKGFAGFWVALFFIFGALSASLSKSPLWSFAEWINFFSLFSFSVLMSIQNKKHNKWLIYAVFGVCVLLGLRLCVGVYIVLVNGIEVSILAHGFSNHRHFTEMIVALMLFFLFSFDIFERRKLINRLVLFLLFSFISSTWFTILATGARASLISFVVSVLAFCFFSRKRVFLILVLCTVSFGFSFFLSFLYGESFGSSSSILRESDSGRVELWWGAIEKWSDSPLLGIGPMHFASIPGVPVAHPHNSVVQLLTEWGVLAFISLLVFFVHISIVLYKERKRLSVHGVAAFSVLTGMVASSFFGGVFVVPATEVVFFLMMGFLLSEIDVVDTRIRISKSVRLFFSILAFSIFLSVFSSRGYQYERGAVLDAPRYWQNGGLPVDKDYHD